MKTLQISRKNKYVICQIDHGKVNAIDTELSRELKDLYMEAETDDTIEGIILTGRPHCFSAGLNIMKLTSGLDSLVTFWRTFIEALQAMTRFSKPHIAAITGFAPAGGTLLACTADYRIMGRGEKHVVGMHEMSLSLVIPEVLARLFAHWIGDRMAMECILHSRLMQADEAHSIGLVNEACAVDDVMPRAQSLMQKITSSYVKSNQLTKTYFKQALIDKMDIDMDKMIDEILSLAQDPVAIQKMVEFQMRVKSNKK